MTRPPRADASHGAARGWVGCPALATSAEPTGERAAP
jgi:hypothetical protein